MSEALAPPLPANDAYPQDLAASGLEDSVFEAAAPHDIQDLLDTPCRAFEREYKRWRNLQHGGGFVLFGFN